MERRNECRHLAQKAVDEVDTIAHNVTYVWPDYDAYATACTELAAAAKQAARLALKLKRLEEQLP